MDRIGRESLLAAYGDVQFTTVATKTPQSHAYVRQGEGESLGTPGKSRGKDMFA